MIVLSDLILRGFALNSKLQLQRDLRNAGRRGLQHTSESWTIDVAVDRTIRIKLRVIESVEGFKAKFE